MAGWSSMFDKEDKSLAKRQQDVYDKEAKRKKEEEEKEQERIKRAIYQKYGRQMYPKGTFTDNVHLTATEVAQSHLDAAFRNRLNMEYEWHKLQQHLNPGYGLSAMIKEEDTRKEYPSDAIPYVKDRPCKACGETNATAELIVSKGTYGEGESYDTSYIRRKCKNCGCQWKEIPLYLIPERVVARMTETTENVE